MKIEKYYLIITSDNDKLSDVICSKKYQAKLLGIFYSLRTILKFTLHIAF